MPNPSTYFDVNADSAFTGIALDNLVDYLTQYNKELDKQTLQKFYNERTIRYFRLSHHNDNTYIASSCYDVDKNGSVNVKETCTHKLQSIHKCKRF